MPSRVVRITAGAFVVAALAAWLVPVVRDRTPSAGTGAPPPVATVSPIVLAPGQTLCASQVVLSPRTEVAQLGVKPGTKATPALEVTADGPGGYRSPPARIAPQRRYAQTLEAPLEPPARELFGRVCVRNAGAERVAFSGTEEFRTRTRLQTSVDGEPVVPDVTLAFFEDRRVSLIGELGGILERMSILRGFLGGAWFLWLLVPVVLVGVPVAVFTALRRALEP